MIPQGGTARPGAPTASPKHPEDHRPGVSTSNLAPTPHLTFSSATWELTCHMRLSLRNFMP